MHHRLDDVLGVAEAATLMSHLPPVGWLDVTTNQQLSALEARIDFRFETVDARFASFEARMDARFEAVDARFASFEARTDARFEAVDARFASLEARMDARFETADAKLDVLRHDFGEQLALGLRDQLRVLVFTFVACILTFASVVIAAVKL